MHQLAKVTAGCLGIIALLVVLPLALCGAYWWLTAPPNLDWGKLFIDPNSLSGKWQKSGVFEECISAPLDSGCNGYQAKSSMYSNDNNLRFIEIVRYYSDEEQASRVLQEDTFLFFVFQGWSEYHPSDSIKLDKVNASLVYAACNENNESAQTRCQYVGQYNHFVVVLWMETETSTFEYKIFNQAVLAVDEKMLAYKDNPPIKGK